MADFLTRAGRFLGISNREGAQIGAELAMGNYGQAFLTGLQSLGDDPEPRRTRADVSGPPAAVDSPATLTQTSQTSRTFGMPSEFDGRILGGPGTGQQSAFIGGGFVPGVVQGVGRLLSRPGVGGALTGVGVGVGLETVTDMFGNTKKLVITRKLQRDVKKVFMMSGGDINFASSNSMMLFGKQLSPDQILQIMFKTFKNQGPYLTKAAVRKTRSTIRKMETLCDLKDRLCPPKPARRRAPARRMSTSITQVK
jgi:hypothetical protein